MSSGEVMYQDASFLRVAKKTEFSLAGGLRSIWDPLVLMGFKVWAPYVEELFGG